jgi:uncharacterized membrane protein YfcA
MIPLRRLTGRHQIRLRYWQPSVAGAVVGFLTGLVLSTGPLSVPVFTGFGLTGGAFLGTEAASSLLLYISKLTTFEQLGALPSSVVLRGLTSGAALMAGALLGKIVVQRISTAWFQRVIDGVLLCAAGGLLLSAFSR